MYLMSTSMVFCGNVFLFRDGKCGIEFGVCEALRVCDFAWKRRRIRVQRLVLSAKRGHERKRPWWERLFLEDDDEVSSSWKEEDVLGHNDEGEEVSEDEKFEAWKRRAEVITELREAQEDARNAEVRAWEDWIGDGSVDAVDSSWDEDLGGDGSEASDEVSSDPFEIIREKGFAGAMRNLITGKDDYELLFEDRVFQFASTSSAKFIALLVLIPWFVSFLVHDYVLMPFLDRYVKTVPLAAEMLDVRRQQKLEMVKTLRIERARYRLEVEIGKSPPLSDEDLWMELRQKAYVAFPTNSIKRIELRDEYRLENRRAFGNIWSDMIYGVTLFILIYANKSKVALLKFTGYKLLNNISDSGKAFLIILVTDIFLGYHSESGWQALIEIILDHYGLEVDQAAITIFISTFPVFIDASVKLWLFKFLPKLSPNVANIFEEMKRH
ncbi:chloroplast envelope membrane protein isoform X1 [Dendrobium catenatum]|uniref:chloroplast envelope membrane protein isoform X1 n=1 Tax=Dendrobium catenatum TaxID=906689 RepID=UPI0009F60486|nr:chloroplast envelope membrane protein isoform X1 [Dendrobium catenatum]